MLSTSDRIISDLGFRSGFLEKTVQMNVERMDRILSHKNASAEYLRQALVDLRADSVQSLLDLQVKAAERLLLMERESAAIIPFVKPGPGNASLPVGSLA